MNFQNPSVNKVAYWSAVLASVFSLTYIVGQLAEWFGWLGSAGGPESFSTALGIVVLLTPSLFLGTAFVMMMVSIHYLVPVDKKIWTHLGITFAAIYAVLISMNYYIQLTLVLPHMMQGETESIKFLLFTPFDSFLYSVDILGYSFMSLSTLLAAFAFSNQGPQRRIRWFMIANGLVLPFVALQTYYHPMIWIAALWAVTFPGATISLAVFVRRHSHA